jgi:hypothetical protein
VIVLLPTVWAIGLSQRVDQLQGLTSTRRRHVLLVDVTQAASEVSRLVHEARDMNLPVEPGVREGRDALVRWAVLLEELLP